MTSSYLETEVATISGSVASPYCPFCGSQMSRSGARFCCLRCVSEVKTSTYQLSGLEAKAEPAAAKEPAPVKEKPAAESRQQSFLSFVKKLRAFSAARD